jgi:hypothetical protein
MVGASAAPAAPATAIFRKSRRDLPLMLDCLLLRRAAEIRRLLCSPHRIAFAAAPKAAEFDLVLNLKTAKALGPTVLQTIFARAVVAHR